MAQNDFKYIIADLHKIYMGARLTYSEILKSVDANPRFKAVIRQYLTEEVDLDTSLESHLYYLQKGEPDAEVYEGLGTSVRLTRPVTRKHLFGREERVYKEEIWKAARLFAMSVEEKKQAGIKIAEVQISKVKLLEFVR